MTRSSSACHWICEGDGRVKGWGRGQYIDSGQCPYGDNIMARGNHATLKSNLSKSPLHRASRHGHTSLNQPNAHTRPEKTKWTGGRHKEKASRYRSIRPSIFQNCHSDLIAGVAVESPPPGFSGGGLQPKGFQALHQDTPGSHDAEPSDPKP
jgi:hypothetical protein